LLDEAPLGHEVALVGVEERTVVVAIVPRDIAENDTGLAEMIEQRPKRSP
jgi:hypothetical protein